MILLVRLNNVPSLVMRSIFTASFLMLILSSCTKQKGKNPSLAYSDGALYDSCATKEHYYYKNDPNILLSGAAGPHGTFKLRFNSIALKALTDNGKLPVSGTMPEGSMIIKDVYRNGNLALYAFMYKKSGSWLWAEIKANKTVEHSVTKNPFVCTDCHSQQGNRDLVVSFKVY